MQVKKNRVYWLIILIILPIVGCQKQLNLANDLETHFYFKNGKSHMPVWIHGNGNSKVFIVNLHGGPGLGKGLELRAGIYAERLEQKYAMVYWDQRGQGSAHGHLDKSDVTIDRMVDDIHVLINVLKAKYGDDISVFLNGHSWGGTLVTAYMLKADYQYQVKGWINTSGMPDAKFEEMESVKGMMLMGKAEMEANENVTEWMNIVEALSVIDTSLTTVSKSEKMALHKQEKAASKLLKSRINPRQLRAKEGLKGLTGPDPGALLMVSNTGQLMIHHFWQEIEKIAMIDSLDDIKIPALIQGGKYDFGPAPSVMKMVYDRIGSNAKYFHIYEHSEHFAFETEPDLYVKQVVDFISLHQ